MKYFDYKVAILGCPSNPLIEWNEQNLIKLRDLGFNVMQLNIAWGCRPADEPLNLEDVVEIPESESDLLRQSVPLKSDPAPQRCFRRRDALRQRNILAKKNGFRTLFHFGAPYNGSFGYDGSPLSNCLLDGKTQDRYISLLKLFHSQFGSIDDILIYTYDQDAWLCSEFGGCPRCTGIPLHERIVPFVNSLAQTWGQINPGGKLWWEPWELSAGQVLTCIQGLDATSVGLMLHSNIAEVMATHPVDRWLKNAGKLAKDRNIPVIVEAWLGAASEELEPFIHLAHPLVTLRQLKSIALVEGVVGIKEYFGLLPGTEDPNLRMTGLFFNNPAISEKKALDVLAAPYGTAKTEIINFWKICSDAMELFPWDTSWYIREIGKCNVKHSMTAAFIRGQQCSTPSWDSTRKAIFMKTDDTQPHPWMLEDVQLRCSLAAEKMSQSLEIADSIKNKMPLEFAIVFAEGIKELNEFRRRAISYVYHIRETNLAAIMRTYIINNNCNVPIYLIEELLSTLRKDALNQEDNSEIAPAIELLEKDVKKFLDVYFCVVEDEPTLGGVSLSSADFSVTSRKSRNVSVMGHKNNKKI